MRIAVLHHPVSAMPPAELARFSGLINIAAAPTLSSRETQHRLGYNGIESVREGTKITVTVCRHVYDGGAGWHVGPKLGPFSPRDYDR